MSALPRALAACTGVFTPVLAPFLVPFLALALPREAGAGEPADALRPLAVLAGHCWKGSLGDGRGTDEHCFAWVAGGGALRDTHAVRAPGRPDYLGDTTYFVDPATHRVAFLYVENLGGVSRGSVEPAADGLVFPEATYADAGGTLTYRARWTMRGETAYEAWSEVRDGTAWKTQFRVLMQREP